MENRKVKPVCNIELLMQFPRDKNNYFHKVSSNNNFKEILDTNMKKLSGQKVDE